MRQKLVALVIIAVVLSPVSSALAATHFQGDIILTSTGGAGSGARGSSSSSATLTAEGSVAGLGNQDVQVILEATAKCSNGKTEKVGSAPTILTKNGRASFRVTTYGACSSSSLVKFEYAVLSVQRVSDCVTLVSQKFKL